MQLANVHGTNTPAAAWLLRVPEYLVSVATLSKLWHIAHIKSTHPLVFIAMTSST